MTLFKQILLIVVSTVLLIAGISTFVWHKRQQFIAEEIQEFQEIQLSYADQVAQKVQFSFSKLRDDLYSLSQIPEVQFLEKNTCLLNMVRIQKLNAAQIDSIYRTDKYGKLRYSFPRTDCPVTGDQLAEIFNTCRTTGNSVFQVIRKRKNGSDYMVIAQPVYTVQGEVHLNPSNKFSGLLYFIVTLNELQNYFFSTSYMGPRGYPWIIDEDGLLVSTANAQHLGKHFYEFLPNEMKADQQLEILSILEKMKKGEKGTGRYSYGIHQDVKGQYYKLTAYTPLKLPNQSWAIAVSTPISDVLVPLKKRTNEFRLFSLSLTLILTAMSLLTILLLRRNQKQQLHQLEHKEEDNRRIRKQWQITFDTVDSMVFLLDKHFTIVRANSAANRILPQFEGEITDQNFIRILHEYAIEKPQLDRSLVNAATPRYTTRIASVNNRIYLLTLIAVKKEASTFGVDMICSLKDITTMEELQEKAHRAQKMESMGIMAGGVAHDLNNILSGIVSYPELILMNLPERSDLRKPIETIRNSGLRAAAVVDDMLTVARGVASAKSTENVNDLISSYLKTPEHKKLQEVHPEISYTTNLSPDIHSIICSPVHVQKCIMNLVANGTEAISNTGKVTILTHNYIHESEDLETDRLLPGNYVVITVTDTGKGISEKDLKRIFEPFYTKKVMGKSGTGLGLTIVWNTMKDHDGCVDVVSTQAGTRFSLYFPASSSQIVHSVETGAGDLTPVMGNRERILVVDDQELQREIAHQILSSLGYEVSSVKSGEDAVEFLQQSPMDLVLLDMIMDPGMNGCETFMKILEIAPEQKALIASGYAEDEHVKKALSLGAKAFIKKPYSMFDLAKAIEAALHDR